MFGDSTIYKVLSEPAYDIRMDIDRCTSATKSLGSTVSFSSPDDVCEECTSEHTTLIDEIESAYSDLDIHLDSLISEYRRLEDENDHLKRIIQDLTFYAVDAVPEDDLTAYEEKLIVDKLEGKE
jgi:hypothetical protein